MGVNMTSINLLFFKVNNAISFIYFSHITFSILLDVFVALIKTLFI